MNELALFAGAGGGILGGKLLGWKTVCAVEFDEHARNVLIARQNDRSLDPFPIWDDVRTFDGKPWRGTVDVVSGGFPCTDISCAGAGAGIEGEKSGLWSEMFRIIREVRPRFTLVENTPELLIRGLYRVIGDLSEIGYNAVWLVMGGRHLKYPIRRDRIWILGFDNKINGNGALQVQQRADIKKYFRSTEQQIDIQDVDSSWLISNGFALRESNGMGTQLDRIERVGNGQIPAVVAAAWEQLIQKAIKAGALHYSLQQPHGGQSVSQSKVSA